MVIIIILMAKQRNHSTFSGKVELLRKQLVLKPSLSLVLHLSSLTGVKCHLKTNVLHLPLLSKTVMVMGEISGCCVFPVWLLPGFKMLFPFLFSFLSQPWQILERNPGKPIFSATLEISPVRGWPYFLGLVLGVGVHRLLGCLRTINASSVQRSMRRNWSWKVFHWHIQKNLKAGAEKNNYL